MGMGSAPAKTQVVKHEIVKKVVPNEYEAFEELMKKHDSDLETESHDGIVQSLLEDELYDDVTEEDFKEILEAYENLCNAFYEKTKLSLNINNIGEDYGGRYDDVGGTFWEVDNVYQLTPEAEAFNKQFGSEDEPAIKDALYTIWG
jgi:hypothetical protein